MTVRSLNLRRYPHQPSCIDYIKVSQQTSVWLVLFVVKYQNLTSSEWLIIQFKPDKKPFFSPHVCGEVDVTDKSAEPNGMVGPRFIYDPLSRLDVAVLTEEASPNDPPNQKPLQIELVFTATRGKERSKFFLSRIVSRNYTYLFVDNFSLLHPSSKKRKTEAMYYQNSELVYSFRTFLR